MIGEATVAWLPPIPEYRVAFQRPQDHWSGEPSRRDKVLRICVDAGQGETIDMLMKRPRVMIII